MNNISKQYYLKAAAMVVEKQAEDYPYIGIPVDPEVAAFMGAFEETAVSQDDVIALEDEPGDGD